MRKITQRESFDTITTLNLTDLEFAFLFSDNKCLSPPTLYFVTRPFSGIYVRGYSQIGFCKSHKLLESDTFVSAKLSASMQTFSNVTFNLSSMDICKIISPPRNCYHPSFEELCAQFLWVTILIVSAVEKTHRRHKTAPHVIWGWSILYFLLTSVTNEYVPICIKNRRKYSLPSNQNISPRDECMIN